MCRSWTRRVRRATPGRSPPSRSTPRPSRRCTLTIACCCGGTSETSLIGPGTVDDAVEVHYGESLAACPDGESLAVLPLIPTPVSDAGRHRLGRRFPRLRPRGGASRSTRVVLVEARERKWSFLKTVALGDRGPGRVRPRHRRPLSTEGVPARVDYATLRALKLSPRAWQALLRRAWRRGRVLIWAGRRSPRFRRRSASRGASRSPETHSKRILEVELVEGLTRWTTQEHVAIENRRSRQPEGRAWARPPPPSTSAPRSGARRWAPSSAACCWSTAIRRATPPAAWR